LDEELLEIMLFQVDYQFEYDLFLDEELDYLMIGHNQSKNYQVFHV
jgi:hypothetical protein